ncbi:hypothetical protein [Bacillus sp. FSL K6-0067]|uniref:hypothetical protein n=1 Tax=Bacillus sp. FSL K6-0067 TaxID=2921412 RepID=UPI00077A44A1|nr:hypothetical protein [Bacillus cereus]KXY11482.1 hypothetical protein AT267_17800 [Bacillus cereus]
MKKLKAVLLLSVTAFGFLAMAEGDTPAPQRPNLAYSEGHTGGAPAENLGDTWSPSYAHKNTGIISNEADGNTGSPAYDHGRPPAPQA